MKGCLYIFALLAMTVLCMASVAALYAYAVERDERGVLASVTVFGITLGLLLTVSAKLK